MQIIKLYAAAYVNYPGFELVSYITNKDQHRICHCHDYYEIFLVDQGRAVHRINGLAQNIATGFLCFIRPRDFHCYDRMSEDFRIINIIIPETVVDDLFSYLGEAYQKERLLKPKAPPSINLDFSELGDLIHSLEQLILYKKIMNNSFEAAYRIAIFNMMVTFFPVNRLDAGPGRLPKWLRWLSLEMLKRENFKKGLPALYRLSGKSPEHLSRSCKKYLNKTPSKLVNDIRLEHSAKLLTTTGIPILDVMEECGFESLSYFYHRFKELYKVSPNELRKQGKEQPIHLMGELSVRAEIPANIPLDAGKRPVPSLHTGQTAKNRPLSGSTGMNIRGA
ncbi:MAG: helix-turn-helix domain-containing protein [Treponema sp.]|jgi:AraC family cel operon transcriptional repressor|nr:helix-turn-helix domain-containing protein [Treponema sp.]